MFTGSWNSGDEPSCWNPSRHEEFQTCKIKRRHQRCEKCFNPEVTTVKRKYALCLQLRRFFKFCFNRDYQAPELGDFLITPFFGDEHSDVAKQWLLNYIKWASQETLNANQKLLHGVAAMSGAAFGWCRKMQLEYATWEDFYFLFGEKYMNKTLTWPGSRLYPYLLHFHGGTVKEDRLSQAAIEAVLTTPSLEHDIGHLSKRLDEDKHSSLFADFKALAQGLKLARHYGVKHILACGHSRRVCDYVKAGTWRVADDHLRPTLHEILNFVIEFETFEIKCCTSPQGCEAARIAHQHLGVIMAGKEAVSYAGAERRLLQIRETTTQKATTPNIVLLAADTWDN